VTTGPAGQCRFCVTLIDGSILGTLLRTLGLVSTNTIRVRNADAIKEKIDAMVSTIRTVPSQYALRLSTLSYELLLDISRNILTPAHPPVLMAAIEYMQKRITNALSLPELCRDLGISVSTCNRLFRTHLSVSPKAFYLQQKAEFAAQLLRTSHLSIKEIAVYTGYEDNHYFSNEFKKRMGCSPRAYRKKTAP
jgi:transcriptional regulator GlxA family with amidase domain